MPAQSGLKGTSYLWRAGDVHKDLTIAMSAVRFEPTEKAELLLHQHVAFAEKRQGVVQGGIAWLVFELLVKPHEQFHERGQRNRQFGELLHACAPPSASR